METKSKLTGIFKRFTSLELLTFAYAVISAIYILIFYRDIEKPYELLLNRLGFITAIAILAFWSTRYKSRILEFIRIVFPLALIMYWYPETYYFNRGILIPNLDPFFDELDRKLFNSTPAMDFSAHMPYAWFSEIMYFAYFSFFIMYVYIGCLFFFKYRHKMYPALFAILASYFMFYIIFTFIPVEGPQFYWAYPDNQVPDGYFFSRLMRFTQSMGEKPTGAFPSSHVGMTLIYMWTFYKNDRKSFWVILPVAILLIMSTVYIKAHYLVDVIGGFLFAPVIYWLSQRIYRAMKQRFPELDTVFSRQEAEGLPEEDSAEEIVKSTV